MPRQKKLAGSDRRNRPQPDQVLAIERALREGRVEDALERVEKLRAQFPRISGLHARRVEILGKAGRRFEAVLAAHDWTEACPNSFAAWDAAADEFAQYGRAALTDRAIRRRNELALHQPPLEPLADAMWQAIAISPYGKPATRDDVSRSELGLLLVRAGRWKEAAQLLDGSHYPCNQNNGALAHYHLGELERALELLLAAFAEEPRNLFALAWVARIKLFLGDEIGSNTTAEALRHAMPERADDALSQLTALMLVGAEDAALVCARRARQQPWWDLSDVDTRALLRHAAAVAAARSGATEEAHRIWREAVDLSPRHTAAQEQLRDLKKPAEERQGHWLLPPSELFPRSWVDELIRIRKQEGDVDEQLTKLGASVSVRYLERAFDLGDPAALLFAQSLLLGRAERGDAAALSALHRCMASHRGAYTDRLAISSALLDRGLASEGQEFMVWDGRELRAIAVHRQKIYRDRPPCDLSTDQRERMVRALQLARRRCWHEARGILETLVNEVPDHPMLLTNLAAVHEAAGNRTAMEGLLRRAHEIDANYLFARCNLARVHLGRGEIDAAEDLLRGVGMRKEIHVLEYIAVNGAEALLHAARGHRSLAENMLRGIAAVAETEDEKARVAGLRATAERLLEGPVSASVS